MREELNKHALFSTLVHTYTLAKQKPGRITQNDNESYLSALRQTFCPTCSLVFLSATWIRWSISSSISLSCIWAWSCALQNKNRIVSRHPTFIHCSPSIISDGIWNCRRFLRLVAEEGGRLFPPIFSIRLSLSLRHPVQGFFFSLSLKAFTHQRQFFSCEYFALKKVFLSILTEFEHRTAKKWSFYFWDRGWFFFRTFILRTANDDGCRHVRLHTTTTTGQLQTDCRTFLWVSVLLAALVLSFLMRR